MTEFAQHYWIAIFQAQNVWMTPNVIWPIDLEILTMYSHDRLWKHHFLFCCLIIIPKSDIAEKWSSFSLVKRYDNIAIYFPEQPENFLKHFMILLSNMCSSYISTTCTKCFHNINWKSRAVNNIRRKLEKSVWLGEDKTYL